MQPYEVYFNFDNNNAKFIKEDSKKKVRFNYRYIKKKDHNN